VKRVRKVDIDYVLRASQLFTKNPIKKSGTARVHANKKRSIRRRKPFKVKCFSLLLRNFRPKISFRSTLRSKKKMREDWQKERKVRRHSNV